ncbi:hypothetical protein [Streptomyces xantholiticus]|uniref:Transposase n=1 Tax=Streptomyces xantholiticus TaxID=68285 RepID=A0ABV1UVN6_9ACTN
MVSDAGSRLRADLADVTRLTGAFADALRRPRSRGIGHAPRRIAVDLVVVLAGEYHHPGAPLSLSDLAEGMRASITPTRSSSTTALTAKAH